MLFRKMAKWQIAINSTFIELLDIEKDRLQTSFVTCMGYCDYLYFQ